MLRGRAGCANARRVLVSWARALWVGAGMLCWRVWRELGTGKKVWGLCVAGMGSRRWSWSERHCVRARRGVRGIRASLARAARPPRRLL